MTSNQHIKETNVLVASRSAARTSEAQLSLHQDCLLALGNLMQMTHSSSPGGDGLAPEALPFGDQPGEAPGALGANAETEPVAEGTISPACHPLMPLSKDIPSSSIAARGKEALVASLEQYLETQGAA